MKAQNGLKFPSELCFGIMNVTKDSYLLSSKVAFLKSGQNAAGICPFFYGAFVHHGFALFFDANSLERQNSERAHGKRKIAQLKRQQFLSLDSQSIRADKDNASFEIVALLPSPPRR